MTSSLGNSAISAFFSWCCACKMSRFLMYEQADLNMFNINQLPHPNQTTTLICLSFLAPQHCIS
jgi:hypothetical protein